MANKFNITERILQYIDYKGISKYKFYKDTGLANGFLDKNSNIGSDKCEIIYSRYSDINIEWLITGLGSMLKNKENNSINSISEPNIPYITNNKKNGIPLIPCEAMAGLVNGDVQKFEFECERYIVPDFKGADYLIRVSGDSMYPKYCNGDIVACRKIPLLIWMQWGKAYIMDTIQGPLCKRIFESENKDNIKLISDNEKYPSFDMPKNEIRALALIVGIIRLE